MYATYTDIVMVMIGVYVHMIIHNLLIIIHILTVKILYSTYTWPITWATLLNMKKVKHIMNTKYSEKSQVRSVLLPVLYGINNNILKMYYETVHCLLASHIIMYRLICTVQTSCCCRLNLWPTEVTNIHDISW